MTLLLGMSKPEGIYMSADYRVTDARGGKLIDDSSVKFLSVRYPPDKGGPTSLLGYTGLAKLPDGTPTGTWMRETLRGESEPFEESMTHLGARLDRDIARLKIPLIINVLVLHGERRYSGGFSNLEMDQKRILVRNSFGYHLQELDLQGERRYSGDFSNLEMDQKRILVRDSFGYHLQELEGPFVFANGPGRTKVIADQHLYFRRAQLGVRPRRPFDHMRLLATVNRSVAQRTKGVSPYCHVQFINADDRTSPMSHTFLKRGETVPFEMPLVHFGVDLSDLTRRFHDQLGAFFRGEVDDIKGAYLDSDAMNNELKRRP
jgi:hypothetical protein